MTHYAPCRELEIDTSHDNEWKREPDLERHYDMPGHRDAFRSRPRRASQAINRGLKPESASGDHSHLREAIDRSRSLLALESDWDDDGAQPITQAVWQRAVSFLERHARRVLEDSGKVIAVPKIAPVSDGSIDLHWSSPGYEMLINIPADPDTPADFYGDDRGRLHIKGTFDTTTLNMGLLQWLTEKARTGR